MFGRNNNFDRKIGKTNTICFSKPLIGLYKRELKTGTNLTLPSVNLGKGTDSKNSYDSTSASQCANSVACESKRLINKAMLNLIGPQKYQKRNSIKLLTRNNIRVKHSVLITNSSYLRGDLTNTNSDFSFNQKTIDSCKGTSAVKIRCKSTIGRKSNLIKKDSLKKKKVKIKVSKNPLTIPKKKNYTFKYSPFSFSDAITKKNIIEGIKENIFKTKIEKGLELGKEKLEKAKAKVFSKYSQKKTELSKKILFESFFPKNLFITSRRELCFFRRFLSSRLTRVRRRKMRICNDYMNKTYFELYPFLIEQMEGDFFSPLEERKETEKKNENFFMNYVLKSTNNEFQASCSLGSSFISDVGNRNDSIFSFDTNFPTPKASSKRVNSILNKKKMCKKLESTNTIERKFRKTAELLDNFNPLKNKNFVLLHAKKKRLTKREEQLYTIFSKKQKEFILSSKIKKENKEMQKVSLNKLILAWYMSSIKRIFFIPADCE